MINNLYPDPSDILESKEQEYMEQMELFNYSNVIEFPIKKYPKKGDKIKVIVHQKRKDKIIKGIFNGKIFTVRSGAVLAEIETEKGTTTIPWTNDKKKVEFYLLAA